MVYNAKTQRGPLVVIFLILLVVLILSLRNGGGSWMLYLHIPFTLLVLAAIFINFGFKISNGVLKFQIRIFTLPIYAKEINHEEIDGLKLTRVGWKKKCAVVQNRKGLNFRILAFNPESIFNDLIAFATDYKIPITKTKDYIILEKMS
ncbi:hypothetical protein ACXYMX_16095 [Sporosarcina sp. CAU 1771]